MTAGHIILIGMPGSGKSKLGSIIAAKMSVPFYELDTEIEKSAGKTIPMIFAEDGEKAFRDEEAHILHQVMQAPDGVVSCGGGIVLREENCQLLKKHNRCIVYLNARLDLLTQRLASNKKRPLLDALPKDEKPKRIAKLFQERDPLYRSVADKIFNINEQVHPNKNAAQLLRLIFSKTPPPDINNEQ